MRRTGPSGGWLIVIRNHESVATVRARVLVDASGQGAVSRRRARFSPPLLAMYAYGERHADRCAGPRIEAGDSEWIWFAPLTATRCICAVFLDPKRLAGAKRESMDDLFRRVLTASRSIAEPAAAASLGEIRFRDATSRAALSHAALDMIRVGDASLAIDPLSSQGVQVAIASALQGAVVVNTLLKGGADAQTAVAFYEDRQNERKELHRSRAAAAYGEVARRDGGPFWQERAAGPRHNVDLGAGVPARATGRRLDPSCVVRLSPTVTFENSAAIRGDLVTTVLAVRAPDLPRPVAFVGGIDWLSFSSTRASTARQRPSVMSGSVAHLARGVGPRCAGCGIGTLSRLQKKWPCQLANLPVETAAARLRLTVPARRFHDARVVVTRAGDQEQRGCLRRVPGEHEIAPAVQEQPAALRQVSCYGHEARAFEARLAGRLLDGTGEQLHPRRVVQRTVDGRLCRARHHRVERIVDTEDVFVDPVECQRAVRSVLRQGIIERQRANVDDSIRRVVDGSGRRRPGGARDMRKEQEPADARANRRDLELRHATRTSDDDAGIIRWG